MTRSPALGWNGSWLARTRSLDSSSGVLSSEASSAVELPAVRADSGENVHPIRCTCTDSTESLDALRPAPFRQQEPTRVRISRRGASAASERLPACRLHVRRQQLA